MNATTTAFTIIFIIDLFLSILCIAQIQNPPNPAYIEEDFGYELLKQLSGDFGGKIV